MDKKSDNEIKLMEKNALVDFCIELQKKHDVVVAENVSLKSLLTDLSTKVQKLEHAVEELKNKEPNNSSVTDNNRLYGLEKLVHANNQYTRRDSIEISGIDTSVKDEHLEEKCIELFENIGKTIKPEQIQACHRLYDGKRCIVKFVNRKSAFDILKLRGELAENIDYKKKVYINESLCPYYRYLYGKCKELWKSKKIVKFWVSNGSVRYRLNENGHPHKVEHIADLENVFGTFP